MAVHKSQVLILKCQDWSETSQVVHLLAREVGRVRCLAKGSRRGLNPFSGPLDRWTLGDAVFSMTDPNRLATLMELFETERFEGLRRKLPAFYGASCITELVLAIVPDAERQPEVYDLLVEALRLLGASAPRECQAVTLAVLWRMLAMLGYVPALDRCIECGETLAAGVPRLSGKGGMPTPPLRGHVSGDVENMPSERHAGHATPDRVALPESCSIPLAAAPLDFSPGHGGPLCAKCRPPAGTLHLAAKAAQAIGFLLAAAWDEVRRVRLTPATATQIRAVLAARFEELAGRKLASLRYV